MEFHIADGGPLYRLVRGRTRNWQRELIIAVLVTWGPLVIISAISRLLTGHVDPLFKDLSVHARLLVSIPLFFGAERGLDRGCRIVTDQLVEQGFVSAAQLDPLVHRAERLRDAWWAEALLIIAALMMGVGTLSGYIPVSGFIKSGADEQGLSAARLWYSLVALPAFQLLMWRALWHWVVWLTVLIGLLWLPLKLAPLHPDRRGGLALLREPSIRFLCWMLPSMTVVAGASWAGLIRAQQARLMDFKATLIIFISAGLIAGFAPLLLFARRLILMRDVAVEDFGVVATAYARRFAQRWFVPTPGQELLGSSDIQSLADLSNSLREIVEGIRFFPFYVTDLLLPVIAGLGPMVPLLLLMVPLDEVLLKLLHLVGGGVPH